MCLGMNPDQLKPARALRLDLQPQFRGPPGLPRPHPPRLAADGGGGGDRRPFRGRAEVRVSANPDAACISWGKKILVNNPTKMLSRLALPDKSAKMYWRAVREYGRGRYSFTTRSKEQLNLSRGLLRWRELMPLVHGMVRAMLAGPMPQRVSSPPHFGRMVRDGRVGSGPTFQVCLNPMWPSWAQATTPRTSRYRRLAGGTLL